MTENENEIAKTNGNNTYLKWDSKKTYPKKIKVISF